MRHGSGEQALQSEVFASVPDGSVLTGGESPARRGPRWRRMLSASTNTNKNQNNNLKYNEFNPYDVNVSNSISRTSLFWCGSAFRSGARELIVKPTVILCILLVIVICILSHKTSHLQRQLHILERKIYTIEAEKDLTELLLEDMIK